jgi:hypothetical protein
MAAQKSKYPKLINLDSDQNRELKRIKKETGINITRLIQMAIKDLIDSNINKKSNQILS